MKSFSADDVRGMMLSHLEFMSSVISEESEIHKTTKAGFEALYLALASAEKSGVYSESGE